jgi:hypothetical protein
VDEALIRERLKRLAQEEEPPPQGLRERMQARMYLIYCWTVPNVLLTRQARCGSSAELFDERNASVHNVLLDST